MEVSAGKSSDDTSMVSSSRSIQLVSSESARREGAEWGYKEQDSGWRGQRVCGWGLCVCLCVCVCVSAPCLLPEVLERDAALSVERKDVMSLLQ